MSSIDLDCILAGDASRLGERLLETPEDQWYERKSVRVKPDVFARALIGFANAEGGAVVVGLGEGQVEGIDGQPKGMNRLRRAPFDLTSPPVRTHFDIVEAENARGVLTRLLVARVAPGEVLHEMANGDCFLRVGDSTMKLGPAQRDELAFDRGAQFEARPLPDTELGDLDAVQLRSYAEAVGAQGSTEEVLHARSLLTQRDQITVAAYLLFAAEPQIQLPHAEVRVLRYGEPGRGTGSRQALLDGGDTRVRGSIPTMIHRAATIIDEWVPQRRALRADGRFGAIPLVPRDAWLEGLVNAVVHRSYSAGGDHIRVEIFPDRMEISSPGRFPGIVDTERPLDIKRYARNPRIARVCYDLAITQGLGEGISRMFEEMRAQGLTDPAYQQTSGSVKLTLASSTRIDAAVLARLPKGSDGVLRFLRLAGTPVGTGEVADAVHRSRPWTLRALHGLREAGLVEWSGKSRKDPRATWSVVRG